MSFRIPAVVEVAVVPKARPDELGPIAPSHGTPVADRARGVITRVGRANWEVRDALSAVVDAVGGLEREVQRLRGLLTLREQGIQLRRELAHVGPDALVLQRPVGQPEGAEVHLLLSIELREAHHLLALDAVVAGFELRFVDPPRDIHDLLVAFTFQQEQRERRRLRA